MPQHDATAHVADGPAPDLPLARLRREIDRIDDAILDLIEERLSCSLAIAGPKQDAQAALLCLRPRREREVLERVTGRSRSVPSGSIDMIWRELMGLCLQAQKRTQLALHAAHEPVLVTNLARLRFGCAPPIIVTGSPDEALHRARTSEAVAIVELSPLSAWWVQLYEDRSLVIFDALGEEDGHVSALAIGRVGTESLPKGFAFPILSEASLRRRTREGEKIRPIAICGQLRLCISQGKQPEGTP